LSKSGLKPTANWLRFSCPLSVNCQPPDGWIIIYENRQQIAPNNKAKNRL